MAGFTSAAAFTIATTQIESLLGLKFDDEGFFNTWMAVFEHIHETKKWDAVLGFSSIAVLLLLRVNKITSRLINVYNMKVIHSLGVLGFR